MAGRPKSTNARTKQYRLRLTEEEYLKLIQLSKDTGKTRADILRESLKNYIKKEIKNEDN